MATIIHTEPDVKICEREYDGIEFFYEIMRIWEGYRTCYYHKVDFADALPFKVDSPDDVKFAAIDNLKKAYIADFIEASNNANLIANKYGYTTITQHMNDDQIKQFAINHWINHLDDYDSINWLSFVNASKHISKRMVHESPFEHGIVSFTLDNVSRSLTHQLVRHRIASYSQMSQRYVSEDPDNINVVLPSKIMANDKAKEVVLDYLNMLGDVISSLKSLGIKNEDLRCIYPNAMTTNIVVTMNFRELKHFLELRMDRHAQDEIRLTAFKIWTHMTQCIPFIWTKLGNNA